MVHAIYQVFERFRVNLSISINLKLLLAIDRNQIRSPKAHHKADLKEIGGYAHEDVNFPEQIEIQGAHPIVVGDT